MVRTMVDVGYPIGSMKLLPPRTISNQQQVYPHLIQCLPAVSKDCRKAPGDDGGEGFDLEVE